MEYGQMPRSFASDIAFVNCVRKRNVCQNLLKSSDISKYRYVSQDRLT